MLKTVDFQAEDTIRFNNLLMPTELEIACRYRNFTKEVTKIIMQAPTNLHL